MDTLGMILAVVVHPAHIQDRDGAKFVLGKLKGGFPRLKLIDWTQVFGGWVLEIVKRNKLHKFVVLPKRWIVERTFGWLG